MHPPLSMATHWTAAAVVAVAATANLLRHRLFSNLLSWLRARRTRRDFVVLILLASHVFCNVHPAKGAAIVPAAEDAAAGEAEADAEAKPRGRREQRSVDAAGRRRHRLVFSESLGAVANADFASRLSDPCGAGSARPIVIPGAPEPEVLSVAGREAEVATLTLQTKVAIREVQADLQSYECDGEGLDSLPAPPTVPSGSAPTPDVLAQFYWHFHALSSHFHFMLSDWTDGESCLRHPENLTSLTESVRDSLRMGMCSLLVSSDPDPMVAPYPTPSMQDTHRERLGQHLYHYHDCSGRAARDCILTKQAKQALTQFSSLVASSTTSTSTSS